MGPSHGQKRPNRCAKPTPPVGRAPGSPSAPPLVYPFCTHRSRGLGHTLSASSPPGGRASAPRIGIIVLAAPTSGLSLRSAVSATEWAKKYVRGARAHAATRSESELPGVGKLSPRPLMGWHPPEFWTASSQHGSCRGRTDDAPAPRAPKTLRWRSAGAFEYGFTRRQPSGGSAGSAGLEGNKTFWRMTGLPIAWPCRMGRLLCPFEAAGAGHEDRFWKQPIRRSQESRGADS